MYFRFGIILLSIYSLDSANTTFFLNVDLKMQPCYVVQGVPSLILYNSNRFCLVLASFVETGDTPFAIRTHKALQI